MKKLLLVAVLLLGFSVMAVAQDVPKVEFYGGYAYFRGQSDPHSASIKLHGWDASAAFNGNKWLGVVVDFSGVYGVQSGQTEIKAHSFLVGPKISIRQGRVAPFGQFLVGVVHARTGETTPASTLNVFGFTFGGGLDIGMTNRVAFRPIQLEYFATKDSGTGNLMDHVRLSAGFVIKLGKR